MGASFTFYPRSRSASRGASAPPVAPATQLAFLTQPAGAASFVAFTTQPVVEIRDASGVRVTAATDAVTLTLASGTGWLATGTTTPVSSITVNAVAGVATFSGVMIHGDDLYTLQASSGTLTAAVSNSLGPGTLPKYTGAVGQTLYHRGNPNLGDYASATTAGQTGGTFPRFAPKPGPVTAGGAVSEAQYPSSLAGTRIISPGKDGQGKIAAMYYPNISGQPSPGWVVTGGGDVAGDKIRYEECWARWVPIEVSTFQPQQPNMKGFRFFTDNGGGPSGGMQMSLGAPPGLGCPTPSPQCRTQFELLISGFLDQQFFTRGCTIINDLVIEATTTQLHRSGATPFPSNAVGYGLVIDATSPIGIPGRYWVKTYNAGTITVSAYDGAAADLGRSGATVDFGSAGSGGTGNFVGLWIHPTDNTKIIIAGFWQTGYSYGFIADRPRMTNMKLTIGAGVTGFTAGDYKVTAIDSQHYATLDRACGTAGATGGVPTYFGNYSYPDGFDGPIQAITVGTANLENLINAAGAGGAAAGNTSVGWVKVLRAFKPSSSLGAGDGFLRMWMDGVRVHDISASAVNHTPPGGYKQYCSQYMVDQIPTGGLTASAFSGFFSAFGEDMASPTNEKASDFQIQLDDSLIEWLE